MGVSLFLYGWGLDDNVNTHSQLAVSCQDAVGLPAQPLHQSRTSQFMLFASTAKIESSLHGGQRLMYSMQQAKLCCSFCQYMWFAHCSGPGNESSYSQFPFRSGFGEYLQWYQGGNGGADVWYSTVAACIVDIVLWQGNSRDVTDTFFEGWKTLLCAQGIQCCCISSVAVLYLKGFSGLVESGFGLDEDLRSSAPTELRTIVVADKSREGLVQSASIPGTPNLARSVSIG